MIFPITPNQHGLSSVWLVSSLHLRLQAPRFPGTRPSASAHFTRYRFQGLKMFLTAHLDGISSTSRHTSHGTETATTPGHASTFRSWC